MEIPAITQPDDGSDTVTLTRRRADRDPDDRDRDRNRNRVLDTAASRG